jgi:hypothetical protein
MAIVLFEITYNIKKSLENNDSMDQETLDVVFTRINEEMLDMGINLDELID